MTVYFKNHEKYGINLHDFHCSEESNIKELNRTFPETSLLTESDKHTESISIV